ncbi:3,5-dihydroxyphenylacetyl-CoA synthase DpgA [Terracoccus luteus]|jgi:polyketide synthase Type III|uniref:(3,5-dihydroxycyclohex-3-enyl)acetyl-CoA synthase n=1 Tax=Terracoccus luteus TaxID=53356 RepID=A0A495Y1L9_9MICO|nr:3,5-dihydroxyphenylacetyl-CoA synthase DpgA [Terracoccus luteus]MBB2988396.1 putative naringenin-chalcone synthase [Terracoccus luteus]MCP2173974.1 putative naringenin-chalcone synthase [Terracoccus luteus]RKT79519.1 (3,5-dihydroxycyclohex-3-enyl)acetyl-CoA synthase [Terracoccus luteus]
MTTESTAKPTSLALTTDHRPAITGVGTANPAQAYTQDEVLDLYRIADPRVRSVFQNGAIEQRHLTLPELGDDGVPMDEDQGQLLAKHLKGSIDIGSKAIREAVEASGHSLEDVDYLCCITTTGFLAPGLSAHLIRALGLKPTTSRLDVVGMGCNAGLNGLAPVAGWAQANPGRLAVMACIEMCSAAYVFDGSMRTAVVNSLFGDGAAAITLESGPLVGVDGAVPVPVPRILDFSSRIIVDAIDAMRYDWDGDAGKFSFFLDPQIPYVVGANAEQTVDALLEPNGLTRDDVAHWVIHPGGKKVIDAVMVNLGLTPHDVRHTLTVLRDFGNLSSGSFLFSFSRLVAEGAVQSGDLGVLMTMGPGSTIETALLAWT